MPRGKSNTKSGWRQRDKKYRDEQAARRKANAARKAANTPTDLDNTVTAPDDDAIITDALGNEYTVAEHNAILQEMGEKIED